MTLLTKCRAIFKGGSVRFGGFGRLVLDTNWAAKHVVKRALCWQPAKMGQSETREIRGLIEV